MSDMDSRLNGQMVYDTNSDRNVESNRISAIRYLLTNYFLPKKGKMALVRYSGGYYFSYIHIAENGDYGYVIEFAFGLANTKIVYWEISQTYAGKIFEI